MKKKFNSFMFGNYAAGKGTKGLYLLGLLACVVVLLQMRSLFF